MTGWLKEGLKVLGQVTVSIEVPLKEPGRKGGWAARLFYHQHKRRAKIQKGAGVSGNLYVLFQVPWFSLSVGICSRTPVDA